MSWRDELRRASWRGIEFDVLAADARFGRRTVLHEYPFRDAVWVEDLGLGARRLHLVGYLVGDDVAAQQDAMIEAAETAGSGELVHPTLGLRQVNLVEFGTAARHDLGRVIELSFTFVESGERIFPVAGISTGDLLQTAATSLGGAAETDFLSGLQAAARGGTNAVRQAQRTLQGWTSTASSLVGGASNAINAVGALVPGVSGNRFSRYLAGSRSPLAFLGTGTNTVSGALSRVGRAQAAARQGAQDLQSLAAKLG